SLPHQLRLFLFFFFKVTAPTAIYTLSLHDALPISIASGSRNSTGTGSRCGVGRGVGGAGAATALSGNWLAMALRSLSKVTGLCRMPAAPRASSWAVVTADASAVTKKVGAVWRRPNR